ncbi:MAG TPA: NADPH-dependent F420 reductase [Acidothermaceae bacterium]
MSDAQLGTIGILGGTGDQGRGLAYRWAAAGLEVIVGSRDAQRAQAAADEIGFGVRGDANQAVAAVADIVIVAVPWDGHGELLQSVAESLVGKIVVDCVNPIGFDDKGAYPLEVAEGSAAQQAAMTLADSRVVAAFHHVSAVLLNDRGVDVIDCDILVLGEDRAATDVVVQLAARIPGARGIYAGRLRNAHQIEALTANLISVNRRYKVHAGIRLTDV